MDGSDMAPAAARPTKMDRVISVGRWLKHEAAEYIVGSWALIIGWFIVAVIFLNLLQMDGHFSRGLGEGSGIDPGLFQNIGWMYGLFGAVFLVLCVRFERAGLKGTAISLKALGTACIFIIMMHAVGFGLKAMESKRAAATAIEDVSAVETKSNTDSIAQLRQQITAIDTALVAAIAPINSEIAGLDNDGLAANDLRSDALRARRSKLEDDAIAAKQTLNDKINDLIEKGGKTLAGSTDDIAKSEKWAPLFVGLAQLFTWNPKPTDWATYIAGVMFNIIWMFMAHLIVIVVPPGLYKLHLKDAKPRHVKLAPDVFAELQAQADELARRKAALDEGVDKALKTKGRKRRRAEAIKLIEDQRQQAVRQEEVKQPETGDSPDIGEEAPTGPAGEDFEDEATEEGGEQDRDPESPEEPELLLENKPDDSEQDKAA